MKKVRPQIGWIWLLMALGLFHSCRNEEALFSGSNARLELRTDTLFFDTVFTQTPAGYPKSVTKQIIVYNPYDERVKTSVFLGAGERSYFRLNVDGMPGKVFEEVEIPARDSIFIFVELSLPPNEDPLSRPLIVHDSIVFSTNGSQQYTQLRAWGQDAHYFLRDTLCNVVWSDVQKPYVISGYVYVPEGCTFTIEKGVKVFTSARSWIYVEGRIRINGTAEEPVEFQADRLEPDYEEVPGQWGGLWLAWPSTDNEIRYALIKNGTVGIYMDSSSSNGRPNARIYNTRIRNMSFDGVAGRGSTVYAENSLITDCGRFTLLAQRGGVYDIRHCTFATYSTRYGRRDPNVAILNIERDELLRPIATFPLSFSMQNSIVYGPLQEEMGWDIDPAKLNGFYFGNNVFKTRRTELQQASLNNVINREPRFILPQDFNYQLDTMSSAIDVGAVLNPVISTDLTGKARSGKPDAGAYER